MHVSCGQDEVMHLMMKNHLASLSLSLAMNVCVNDDDECKQESIEFLGFLLQPMCTFPPRVDRQLLPTHRLLLISHHLHANLINHHAFVSVLVPMHCMLHP